MITRKFIVSLIAASTGAICGCGGGSRWQYDFDAAIKQARAADRDLVIIYKDPLDERSGGMVDILESPEAASRIKDKIRCMLVPYYGPNVRFMAQYGIDESPAIVIVHPDSTYHSLGGVHPAQEVTAFLDSAHGTGRQPTSDPRIARRETFQYFNTYEQARDKAHRQNRRLVIVYKWWLDGQSSELIRRISSPHIAKFFVESVNCLLDWDYVPNREIAAQYGVGDYPAVIIVEPDGSLRTMIGLQPDEYIIHFATARRSGQGSLSEPDLPGETHE